MTYKDRKKMEELSLKAFGGKNKYVKLYQRGYKTDMVEIMEDGTERKYKGYKYQTHDEIHNVMIEMIAKKEQEEAEKKAKEISSETTVKVNV
jgi:hypothetical protein